MSNLGLAALIVGFASLPFVRDVGLLAGTMLLFSFGMALANTGITALISNAASDREQGMVLGTSSSLDSLSGILAPPDFDEAARDVRSRFCRRRIVDDGERRAGDGSLQCAR